MAPHLDFGPLFQNAEIDGLALNTLPATLSDFAPTFILGQADKAPLNVTALIALLVFGIAFLLVLILRFKLQAFLSLILVSVVVAATSRLVNPDAVSLTQVAGTIVNSMGGALGFIATIIGIGAIFGAILEHSGGTQSLANSLVKMFGAEKAPWAMLITGFIISIPVFLDVALVILAPLLFALARDTKKPYLIYGLSLCAGMAVTHAFVPPTPGPVAVAFILGVNLGWVILWGVVVGLPTAIICGPWLCKRLAMTVDLPVPELEADENLTESNLPGFGFILFLIAMPIALILSNTIVEQVVAGRVSAGETVAAQELAANQIKLDEWNQSIGLTGDEAIDSKGEFEKYIATLDLATDSGRDAAATAASNLAVVEHVEANSGRSAQVKAALSNASWFEQLITFVGHPVIALLLSTIAALYFLGNRRGVDRETLLEISTKALGPAGIIILITGAGGVFKGVLKATGITDALAQVFADSGIPILVLAYVFATLIRIAQGSATVAMLTAAGLMVGFIDGLSQPQLALVTIAIAAGATGFSHVNDSGFWMISRYMRMSEAQTLKTWSVVSTAISVVGFAITMIVWNFV